MPTTLRVLPLLLAAAACSGSQNPPAPVATAAPSGSGDAVQPLSSRDTASAPASVPGSPAVNPPLPPGHPPIPPPGGAVSSGPARSSGAIAGTIELAPALRTMPTDVLYVMAKKGKTTLAVRRFDKPSFPLAFEISAADAMQPGAPLDGPVDVVARVSRSGDAIAARGDLEGTARGVKVPAKGVTVRIDSVRQ